jgi:hypothetical protein
VHLLTYVSVAKGRNKELIIGSDSITPSLQQELLKTGLNILTNRQGKEACTLARKTVPDKDAHVGNMSWSVDVYHPSMPEHDREFLVWDDNRHLHKKMTDLDTLKKIIAYVDTPKNDRAIRTFGAYCTSTFGWSDNQVCILHVTSMSIVYRPH